MLFAKISVLNFNAYNGKVHKVSEFRCHTPSSQPFRILLKCTDGT